MCTAVFAVHGADAIPGEQWCDERVVDDIRFAGNKVTRPQIIQRELIQQSQSVCSLDDVIDGLQNILDLGLFHSVHAELSLHEDTLVLWYVVKEKIFFLPIPRFSRTSDGELRLGVQLRWDNFLGRLHQLKLTSEKRQENDGRGRTGFVHSLDYTVPRFLSSRYGMAVNLASVRRNSELTQDGVVFGEALRETQRFEWRLARWANLSESVKGLSYFAGAGFEERNYELRSGQIGPFRNGRNVTLITGLEFDVVHQDSYRRRGHFYGATFRLGQKILGGDFNYARLDASMRWYLPMKQAQANLNVQLQLGLSTLALFGEHSFGIGGGELMRGMRPGLITGNILTLTNIEYLSGFFAYPAWRWVVFADIGNVYTHKSVNLLKQHARVGAGLRYKLRAITNTDLRMDAAWDPRREKLTPYLSSSVTF